MLSIWHKLVPEDTPRTVRINLVIVGAFALVALLFLTRTTFAALSISHDIEATVNPAMAEIGDDTVLLPALDRTGELTGKIAEASAPLSVTLGQVVESTDGIGEAMSSTERHVLSIEGSVASIEGSVTDIRTSMEHLAPLVTAIAAQTGDITKAFDGVEVATEAVAGDVADIYDLLTGTVAAVRRIDGDVEDIDEVLDTAEDHAQNIRNSEILEKTDAVKLGNVLDGPDRAPR